MSIRTFFIITVKALLLVIVNYSCTNMQSSEQTLASVTCNVDCEGFNSSDKKHKHYFPDGNEIEVLLNKGVTKEESFEGTKSILLTKRNKYGLSTKLTNIKLDEYYKVSVWRKDKKRAGALVVSSTKEDKKVLYYANKNTIETRKDGWEKIEVEIEIPPHAEVLNIYCFIAKADSAYFDQLEIIRTDNKTYPNYPEKKDQRLSLYFGDEEINSFNEERKESFSEGVHFSNNDWNKGVLSGLDQVVPIKARLKGDWLDHLEGEKWSLRIKVKKNKTFNGFREFSLQTTASRYHLHEYLSHQLFLQEELLTTNYDFFLLYFNGESRGIYAMEEHFTKQLIEKNKRREGPILKFDEDPMWRQTALRFGLNAIKGEHQFPNYEVSRILPFGKSKVLSTEKLKTQFLIGQSLLYQLKNRAAPIDDIFEIEKLAKFLALTDLTQGTHGRTWHNTRFYYNPISCKLELINYDNYTDYFKVKEFKPIALTINPLNRAKKRFNLFKYMFSSEALSRKYYTYLEKYSQPQFIIDFYALHREKIQEILPQIQNEFPSYNIDSTLLLNNAKVIRSYLPEIKEKIDSGFFNQAKFENAKESYSNKYISKIFPYYLNAYYYRTNDNKAELLLENFNNRAVLPIRLLDKKKKPILSFPNEIKTDRYNKKGSSRKVEIPFNKMAYFVEFKDLDSNKIHLTELSLWEKRTSPSPYQKLSRSTLSSPEQVFSVSNDTFRLTGQKVLTNKIIIPEGKKVIIDAGTVLDLTQQAAIVSYSAIQFEGTKEKPILIHSSDQTANGIVVLQAKQKSLVEYTTFSDLNTFSFEGWNLSGAVNFYESEVEIQHSAFKKNHCEDALNIIRTNFLVSNCVFEDIFADAFDSDFCSGELSQSRFDRVGNDAIDFSTSQININNCIIKNIQDKGISGGEGSTLWVKDVKIDNCNIAVASKDLSEVNLNNIDINHSKYGLVLLQKKPEYGPAKITTEKLNINNCEETWLIEKGSELYFEGKPIKGVQKNVAKIFY